MQSTLHDGSSGFLVQSIGGQFSVFGSHGGCLQEGSSCFLVQSGLHDGSSGVVVQSIGGVVQDSSLGFALQSTGGGVVHDGSSGFVLQSIGDCVPQEGSFGLALQSIGPGVVLHDGSFGVVLQSIGPGGCGDGGSGTLEHSGEVDPCSHVDDGGCVDGIIVGVGSPIEGGGGDGFGSSVVGLLPPLVPLLSPPPPLSLPPLRLPLSPLPLLLSPPLLPEESLDFFADSGISFENTCRY